MSGVALGISAAAAVAGVAVSSQNARKQQKAADKAARLQQHENEVNRANQTMQMRQANQQQADLDGILDANTGADNGATMITGGLGVDKSKLNLGKGTTLLGG